MTPEWKRTLIKRPPKVRGGSVKGNTITIYAGDRGIVRLPRPMLEELGGTRE